MTTKNTQGPNHSSRPNRRDMLSLITAGTLVSVAACSKGETQSVDSPAVDSSAKLVSNPVFAHGIASGDPDSQSVVLWTRVTSTKASETVNWEVSLTKGFKAVVAKGSVQTSAAKDYTVKAIASGLAAGKTHYYRFKTETMTSPIGRTKTLPTGKLDKLGIALASCSNHAFGFFNAYAVIAKDEAVDFVLHAGDYIYEYGVNGWGGETSKVLGREHFPAHEIVSLSDYRARHAQYKSDAGSLAMHAAHPLICMWDDHESANNPWTGGAKNHNPDEGEGDWLTRRAASVQAYYEWLPVRDMTPGQTKLEFWRQYSFGDLATLVTLETRHTARAKQIKVSDYADDIHSQEDAQTFKDEVIGAPGRKMISSDMEAFLLGALSKSVTDGQPWRLVGSPIPVAKMPIPDIANLGVLKDVSPEQLASDEGKSLIWKGKYSMPYYTDSWVGYPWAQEKLYKACQSVGVEDLLFLSGDSHSFWMNRLFDDSGKAMGVEIGTTGVTSPGDFLENGWDPVTAERLDRIFETEIEEVVWTDNLHQGYVRVDLTPEEVNNTFVAVSTILKPVFTSKTIKKSTIKHSGKSLDFV